MTLTRRDLLLAGLGAGVRRGHAAESLRVRLIPDRLLVAAPQLRFLMGRPLERLHNGASVWFDFQLSAVAERPAAGVAPRVLERAVERFAVSYDLWEEKFAVAKLGTAPRSVSHLSAEAAEAWCVDNTSVPVAAIPGNSSFWLRLDYQADSPASAASDPQDNSGSTMAVLVDIFSRRTRAEQVHGFEETGPLRLENLKRR